MQYPLLILTAVLLGGAATFAYSYAPLHRAKDWQIAYLEERLHTRTEQVETLEEELRQAEATVEGQPSNDEVKSLRAQLDEAQGLNDSLEKQVGDLEQKLAQATQSRDSWKKKHGALVAEVEARTRTAAAASQAENGSADEPDAEDGAAAAPGRPVAATPQLGSGRSDPPRPPAALDRELMEADAPAP